eukprot:scaffold8084_cov305-Pinguiococcus_pyrenoidosus.AAC.3
MQSTRKGHRSWLFSRVVHNPGSPGCLRIDRLDRISAETEEVVHRAFRCAKSRVQRGVPIDLPVALLVRLGSEVCPCVDVIVASNQASFTQLWKPHGQVLQDAQVVMTSVDVDEVEVVIRVAQGTVGREVATEAHLCSKPTSPIEGLAQNSLLLFARDICAVDVVRLLPPEVDQDIKLRTMPLFQH